MDLSDLSDEQIYELAAPIWDKMSKGLNNIDYETFSSSFCVSQKEQVNKERFDNQCKTLPLLTCLGVATPVACIIRKEGVTVVFWQLSTCLEGEFIGQLTLSGTKEKNEVINAQVY